MHQTVSTPVDSSRRWGCCDVVAAQFMFGVDAFIVTSRFRPRHRLQARRGQIEAVIAIYLIALCHAGGPAAGSRYPWTKNVFCRRARFTLNSLVCWRNPGPELIAARLAQGATAALMVTQVSPTICTCFPIFAGRAFGIYGIVLGLAGAAGFFLGGLLVTMILRDWAGARCSLSTCVRRWIIMAAASASCRRCRAAPARGWTFPVRSFCSSDAVPDRAVAVGARCALGAVDLAGNGGGVAIIAAFLDWERAVARRGGMPLIDLALFVRCGVYARLYAAFFFLFCEPVFLSCHDHVHAARLTHSTAAGWHGVRAAGAAFVIASRHSGHGTHRGTLVLIEGCAVQTIGLALLVLMVAWTHAPSATALARV